MRYQEATKVSLSTVERIARLEVGGGECSVPDNVTISLVTGPRSPVTVIP